MSIDNFVRYLKRNGIAPEDRDFFKSLLLRFKSSISPTLIQQIALSVMGHVEDRMHSYIYDKNSFDKKVNKIFKMLNLDANF